MDRKLNKKELKFLQKLGVSVNENASLAEIHSILKLDTNQNIPIVASESESIQSNSVANSVAVRNSLIDVNQNLSIATSENEMIHRHFDEKKSSVPSSSKNELNHSATSQVAVPNTTELSTTVSNATFSSSSGSIGTNIAVSTVESSIVNTSAQTVQMFSDENRIDIPNSDKATTESSGNEIDSVTMKSAMPIVTSSIVTPIVNSSEQTEIPYSAKTTTIATSSGENNISDSAAMSTIATSSGNDTIEAAKSNIDTLTVTSSIVSPIVSSSVQTSKSWAQMIEDEQGKSCVVPNENTTKQIDESDFFENSEIKHRIQSEQDKLKLYASQLHRLRNEVAIIEHQREIAILNLSTLEASLNELNSETETQSTGSSVSVEKPIKSSVVNQQQVSSVQSRSSVQNRLEVYSATNRQPASLSRPESRNSASSSSESSDPLCFNCSSRGHISRDCKQPRRVKGSCFKCGSTSHVLKDCRSKGDNRGTFDSVQKGG